MPSRARVSGGACLWLVGVALAVGALLRTDRLLWQPGLTEDNVRRLRPGMTLAEVEALLGGPAAVTVDMHPVAPEEERGYRWLRRWQAEGAAVDVLFFEDGARDGGWGGGSRGQDRLSDYAPGWGGEREGEKGAAAV